MHLSCYKLHFYGKTEQTVYTFGLTVTFKHRVNIVDNLFLFVMLPWRNFKLNKRFVFCDTINSGE